tara:strand:+ start:702 stop:890 length:189 start_codon:yes stop_codon:yes gene_type:complete
MINFIKHLFQAEPGLKLRKQIIKKQELAMQLQRNGKLREYAEVMKEIETLELQYEEAINENR